MKKLFLIMILFIQPLVQGWTAWPGMAAYPPRLKVSDNQRFLVYEDGKPFFYLGDTAWELFHRLNREEADRYLENRARLGFTVVQAVALAEEDGLGTPNAYGHLPLINQDPTRLDTKEGPANDYWDHVDYIVDRAAGLGLFIGFLPTWGDKWNKKWGVGPEIFTPENAQVYGEWIGRRYKDKPIIWILGGDRPVETDRHREIIQRMAAGLRKGDEGTHLITFHPTGGQGSSAPFHDAEWLDFNMRQNGHAPEFTGRYSQTRLDYDRIPVKPVLDGEPIYEDHPVSFDSKKLGHSIAADVRCPLYWDLFGGAFGHTYGHHSVWQFSAPDRKPKNDPLLPWFEAIDQPGAHQMKFGRLLMESRPFLTRIPDDTLIAAGNVPTAMPGTGRYHFAGTRDSEGSYAMVYAPVGRRFTVRTAGLTGSMLKTWWYNPRNGEARLIGTREKLPELEFMPPDPGEFLDWVLVLEDASRNFPPPGQPLNK